MAAKERWGSKLGIILAVAGSAVGLGNFLRFPVQAARNGGGAFMIPYFVALILLGVPLMWIEWTVGRFGGGFGHSTAPGMFHSLWNKNRFIKYFGVIGILGPLVIYIYYVYVESWLLGYSYFALAGSYKDSLTPDGMLAFLHRYQGIGPGANLELAYLFFALTFAVNIGIVYLGVQRGIERVCKYALPLLFALGLVLMVRVLTLGAPDPAQPDQSVIKGLAMLWTPDWSALLNAKVWLAAAGQVFFTLSVGIGVILTYASYLTPRDDIALSGLTAASANEVAEVVLGGSIVIPAACAFFGVVGTAEVAKGGAFNLGFVTMPLVLGKLPAGEVFGFIWFALLFLAGVTSSISLAQPAVVFLEDEFNMSRREAVGAFAGITFVLTQPIILFLGHGVMDEMDFWGATVFLVVFATIETILFGWVFGIDRAWQELHVGSDITIPRIYRYVVKYVTPLVLLGILGWWFCTDWLPVILLKGVNTADVPYIIWTRLLLVLLLEALVLMVWISWKHRAARAETAGASGPPEPTEGEADDVR
jgi:NSS family neurotransmitter:Na+ symporter